MIPLVLWQLRWRILVVLGIAWALYLLEPGFHIHEALGPDVDPTISDPRGLGFTLANLAGASMLVLLTGFVAADRRRGYYRMYFAHPTPPLAYSALRWGIAYALSLLIALLFLVIGQLAAWGEMRAGLGIMVQPVLFALVYGGIAAFFSAILPRGDTLAALGVFALTSIWEAAVSVFAEVGREPLPGWARQAIGFILPPHLALRDFFDAAVAGHTAWGSLAFAAGYGIFWLAVAALLLWTREWP